MRNRGDHGDFAMPALTRYDRPTHFLTRYRSGHRFPTPSFLKVMSPFVLRAIHSLLVW